MSKKVAVILSGCGHKDGAEITEAVSALVALSEAGASYQVFAPDVKFKVQDPITNKPTEEIRNVLLETARIARGDVQSLALLKAKDFDALAIPGGSGAAMHLSSWMSDGSNCKVDTQVERVINEFYMAEKPIAAICIAPVILAKVLGEEGITITTGNNKEVALEIQKTGALHEECKVDDFVTDRAHRIITTPAYMYGDAKPFEVFTGVRKAIRELVEMA